jgi:hypothetical protein
MLERSLTPPAASNRSLLLTTLWSLLQASRLPPGALLPPDADPHLRPPGTSCPESAKLKSTSLMDGPRSSLGVCHKRGGAKAESRLKDPVTRLRFSCGPLPSISAVPTTPYRKAVSRADPLTRCARHMAKTMLMGT